MCVCVCVCSLSSVMSVRYLNTVYVRECVCESVFVCVV